jgi:hypothetical protein
MALQKQKIVYKKNIPGYYEGGQFRPIRSPQYVMKAGRKVKPTKADLKKYDRDKAGDNDDVFDREIRKANNLKKSWEIWQQQEENRVKREMFGGNDTGSQGKTLVQFVRAEGGIKRTYNKATGKSYDAGELDGLTFKQSKKKGLVSDTSGKPLDKMFQAAREAGFDVADESDLIDRMDDEIRKGKATYQTHSFLDYKDNPTSYDATFTVAKEADNNRQKGLYSVKVKRSEKLKPDYILRGVSKKIADETANYFNEEMLKLKKVIKKNPGAVTAKAKKTTGRVTAKAKKTTGRVTAKTKKRTTAKKTARPRKNGILTALATAAVATSAALNVYDRLNKNTKKPTPSATGADTVLKHNKAVDVEHHEKEFDKFLVAIEKGDFSKVRSAKMQGKLANYSDREVEYFVKKAKFTSQLKLNPTPATIARAEDNLLKLNGIISRTWARQKATNAYRRQLKLESALLRAKSRKAKFEAKAKKNPAAKVKKNPFDAFENFHGRPSTKTIEIETPKGTPKHIHAKGKLLEIRMKGGKVFNFRKANTGKNFYLVSDEQDEKLYIAGGKIAEPDTNQKPGDLAFLGVISHLIYETKKAHLDDKGQQGYIHKLGEEGGEKPSLEIDKDGFAWIVGGDYYIAEAIYFMETGLFGSPGIAD